MKAREDRLNEHFSLSEFKLDQGEALLKEMQQLRDELSQYEDEVQRLIDSAMDIVPLRARRERLRQPIEAIAICKFQSKEISIQKDEICTIRDNSNMLKWKVTNSRGQQGEAPGAMFVLRPPDSEAVDRAEKLKRYYDRVITLWQKKHLRMRQNMIFATIKVVKSWDFQQFLSMGKEQRTAIRRALNEDSEKLIQEGEPNDPQLKRLQREIDEVNRLFDEWERRAAMEEERRNAAKLFNDKCDALVLSLAEYEKQIIKVGKLSLVTVTKTIIKFLLHTFLIKMKLFNPFIFVSSGVQGSASPRRG
jgi:dystonin